MSKGQIFTLDFFVGLAIFIVLFMVLLVNLNKYQDQVNTDIISNRLQQKALQITDILIKTQGVPTNWEKNNTSLKVPGLASYDRILNSKKVDTFTKLKYNRTKKLLNIDPYEFYFKLETPTDIKTYGLNISGQAINIKRYIYYQNEKAILEFAIWK